MKKAKAKIFVKVKNKFAANQLFIQRKFPYKRGTTPLILFSLFFFFLGGWGRPYDNNVTSDATYINLWNLLYSSTLLHQKAKDYRSLYQLPSLSLVGRAKIYSLVKCCPKPSGVVKYQVMMFLKFTLVRSNSVTKHYRSLYQLSTKPMSPLVVVMLQRPYILWLSMVLWSKSFILILFLFNYFMLLLDLTLFLIFFFQS